MKYCLNCGQREEKDRRVIECSRPGGHLFSEIGLDKATAAVRTLLQMAGYDPSEDDLIDTPYRVMRSFMEMTAGEREDPKEILGKEFEAGCDGVVILRGIHFTSTCEHHLMPFVGTADVGYVPGSQGRVVGLSKLARLVECFARRLQLQEALTQEIAQALMKHLKPKGAAVVIRAHHSCMGCRGVRKQDAEMVTSEMLGVFRDKPEARAEFLTLCRS